MKNIQTQKKNGSNKYVIRGLSNNYFVFHVIIFTFIFCLSISMVIEEYFFMENIEKCLTILGLFSLILFFCVYLWLYFVQIIIIDFDKETIKMKKKEFLLKEIVKIEYIKDVSSYDDDILVYRFDKTIKFYFCTGRGYFDTEKIQGYPMAKKIEEINNKLQEYRKQNNLD